MPTQTKENYLKALYYLDQKDSAISITSIGEEMSVSKPTANNMVKRLQEHGWVSYEKYKPLLLTDLGRKQAAIIIRKHRLAEMFLSQVMGFGWEEVHEMAEEIEHLPLEKFFDRMDELLGFPSEDPHGSPIPDKNGNITKSNYILLSQVSSNQNVKVRGVRHSSTEFLLYLDKKEIQLGTELFIHQVEPFDSSYVVSYAGHNEVVLSQDICSRLLVEE